MFWYWFPSVRFCFSSFCGLCSPARALHLLIDANRLLFKLFSMRLLCVNIVFSIYEPLPRCCPNSGWMPSALVRFPRISRPATDSVSPSHLSHSPSPSLSVCFIALARRQISIGNLMNRNWKSSAYENLIKIVSHPRQRLIHLPRVS